MRRRPFVVAAGVAVILAVLIPVWVYVSDADENAGDRKVPANLVAGKDLFDTNCGTCHTLYAAGTDGNFGPNLDTLLAGNGPATDKSGRDAIKQRVLNAINEGVDSSTPGRMPAGILGEQQANEVADFLASEAGK